MPIYDAQARSAPQFVLRPVIVMRCCHVEGVFANAPMHAVAWRKLVARERRGDLCREALDRRQGVWLDCEMGHARLNVGT